ALPGGGLEPPLHLGHLGGGEAVGHHFLRLHAADQVVQDPVDLVVADAVVALGGLTGDQVGGGGLGEDHLRDADVAGQGAHLRLEEIAQRIHGGRVVGVHGEIAEQPIGLGAGDDQQDLVVGVTDTTTHQAIGRSQAAATRRVAV